MLQTLISELMRAPSRWRLERELQDAASLLHAGRAQEASSQLRQLLERHPGSAKAHGLMGLALHRLGGPGKALAHFQRAAALDPADASLQGNHALALREVGMLDEAEAVLRALLAREPRDAGAINNLGVVLADLGRVAEARALVEPAVAAMPESLELGCTLARVLLDLGEAGAAAEHLDEALSRHPQSAEAKLSRATCRLSLGDFGRGWDDYAARIDTLETPARGFPFPEWNGEDPRGKSILVYAEQGIGDELMFAGCYHELVQAAGRVVLECDPRLAPMLRRSFPGATVVADRSRDAHGWIPQAGSIDAQVPAGSLPRLYRRDLQSFPRHQGYLVADAERIAHYRARLDALGNRRKVGIAWRGGVAKTRRALRSVEPAQLRALLERDDTEFVCLQHGLADADLAALRAIAGPRVQHWPDALAEVEETAALLSALDFTVTACNYLVHLGGALGRDVRVMVPACPEWRYLRAGEALPWYPAVRLFRQVAVGEWKPVVDMIAASF